MNVIVVKPGECAICSKPVTQQNSCNWSNGVRVHHSCLPRVAKMTYVDHRQQVGRFVEERR